MLQVPQLTRLRAILCTIVVITGLLEFLHGRSQELVYFGGMAALAALLVLLPVTTRYTRVMALILCFSVLYFSSLNSISAGCLLVTFAWGGLSGKSFYSFSMHKAPNALILQLIN
ncbi:MAG: hypothetical protein C4554_01735 [Dethiobacter sp.]|nr:MAG: hypothetical protein C4554_01735 [Dethiobacter sp.]